MLRPSPFATDRGSTLLEVLVTIGVLAFGLLGLAGLMSKVQLANVESYQRAQAMILLSSMVERMNGAPAINAAAVSCYSLATIVDQETCVASRLEGYVSTRVFGAGDPQPHTCPPNVGPERDQCEWSAALKGATEVQASTKQGAMTEARGCIVRLQAPNPAPAVCTPGIYLVTVAWQGFNKTAAPDAACAANLYGDDAFRRTLSSRVVVGLPGCV